MVIKSKLFWNSFSCQICFLRKSLVLTNDSPDNSVFLPKPPKKKSPKCHFCINIHWADVNNIVCWYKLEKSLKDERHTLYFKTFHLMRKSKRWIKLQNHNFFIHTLRYIVASHTRNRKGIWKKTVTGNNFWCLVLSVDLCLHNLKKLEIKLCTCKHESSVSFVRILKLFFGFIGLALCGKSACMYHWYILCSHQRVHLSIKSCYFLYWITKKQ